MGGSHGEAPPGDAAGRVKSEEPEQRKRSRDDSRLREHLANERTLLSWIRLGLASAGFGFVVARFGLFLRATSGQNSAPSLGPYAEAVGIGLVLLGPVLVVTGSLRYFRTEREIEERVYRRRYGSLYLVIAANVVLGIALAGYLLLTGR